MEQYKLKKPEANKKRKRVGRGMASGSGKTCDRGMNGQLSRSGSKKRAWFEGGQMPIQRRVPKRGFSNYMRDEYQIVNISSIAKIGESDIGPEILKNKGLIRFEDRKIKILGNGELSGACTVQADAFSASASKKIEDAGGKAVLRDKIARKKKVTEKVD